MAARKHNPGPTPKRGDVAHTVVSVRLTSDELACLDSLWPHPGRRVVRGDVIRDLIARAEPRQPTEFTAAERAQLTARIIARTSGYDANGRPVVAIPLPPGVE